MRQILTEERAGIGSYLLKQFNNKILLVILFSLTSLSAFAQLSIGGRAGINVVAEPFKNYTHLFLARPYIGVLTNYKMKHPFSFQLEVNVSGEGSYVKDPVTSVKFKDTQTYLNIPFLVQYRFIPSMYLEAGPQLGILLSARADYNGDKFNTKSYYNNSVPGFLVGLGREVKRTPLGSIGINLRYMRTLSSVTNNQSNAGFLAGGENLRNRVLSLGVTYKWDATN